MNGTEIIYTKENIDQKYRLNIEIIYKSNI
jgi:hypothetical protein